MQCIVSSLKEKTCRNLRRTQHRFSINVYVDSVFNAGHVIRVANSQQAFRTRDLTIASSWFCSLALSSKHYDSNISFLRSSQQSRTCAFVAWKMEDTSWSMPNGKTMNLILPSWTWHCKLEIDLAIMNLTLPAWTWQHGNKSYSNIAFILFTPFFKVDGNKADKICGNYTSRTHKVAQLLCQRTLHCSAVSMSLTLATLNVKNLTWSSAMHELDIASWGSCLTWPSWTWLGHNQNKGIFQSWWGLDTLV